MWVIFVPARFDSRPGGVFACRPGGKVRGGRPASPARALPPGSGRTAVLPRPTRRASRPVRPARVAWRVRRVAACGLSRHGRSRATRKETVAPLPSGCATVSRALRHPLSSLRTEAWTPLNPFRHPGRPLANHRARQMGIEYASNTRTHGVQSLTLRAQVPNLRLRRRVSGTGPSAERPPAEGVRTPAPGSTNDSCSLCRLILPGEARRSTVAQASGPITSTGCPAAT